MPDYHIFYPLFAMFLLFIIISIRLVIVRNLAVFRQEISIKFFQHYQGQEESPALRYASRNFTNLFETPVFFYLVLILFYVTNHVTDVAVTLSWVFVFLRYVHSLIHVTYNNVLHRFVVFAFSLLILVALWGYLGFFLFGRL